jgi:membrane protein implicated in regulation of membrane protease activity
MMEWSDYWVWFAAAIVLGILEILAPGYILLGFALAAGVIGAGLWFGGGVGAFLAGSLPVTLVIFAVISLVLWLVLRKLFGARGGSVKVWDTDINEN